MARRASPAHLRPTIAARDEWGWPARVGALLNKHSSLQPAHRRATQSASATERVASGAVIEFAACTWRRNNSRKLHLGPGFTCGCGRHAPALCALARPVLAASGHCSSGNKWRRRVGERNANTREPRVAIRGTFSPHQIKLRTASCAGRAHCLAQQLAAPRCPIQSGRREFISHRLATDSEPRNKLVRGAHSNNDRRRHWLPIVCN